MQSKKCRYTSIRICITQSNYVEQIVTGINVWSKVTSWSKHNDKENEEYTALHITQRFHQLHLLFSLLLCFLYQITHLSFPFSQQQSQMTKDLIRWNESSCIVHHIVSHIRSFSLTLPYLCMYLYAYNISNLRTLTVLWLYCIRFCMFLCLCLSYYWLLFVTFRLLSSAVDIIAYTALNAFNLCYKKKFNRQQRKVAKLFIPFISHDKCN